MSRLLHTLILALALTAAAQAQPAESRAGLVVQYAGGEVETACVRFSELEISGIELLERSGIPAVIQGSSLGAAVCKIGPDGCDYPAESCFCERDGARSTYWAFYSLEGGAWSYANLGAASVSVRDGTVHGWAWGEGESGSGAQPPALSLEAVCGAEAEPTATEARTSVTQPPAVASAAPSASAGPAATTAPPAATPARGGAGAPLGYIGFAALALVLIAGAALAARR
jgi:hypothetical protein